MADGIHYLGYIAGALTTGAFLPQVIQTWRTRSTKDISLPMYATIFVGSALWLLHGLSQGDMALVGANSITLALQAIILGLKLRHG